jgi:hypothetical protein
MTNMCYCGILHVRVANWLVLCMSALKIAVLQTTYLREL